MENGSNYSRARPPTDGKHGGSKLVEYGIEHEQSDIRAHVSIPGRCIIAFRTRDMLALVSSRQYRLANASQPGVNGVTGRGRLVPLEDVESFAVTLQSARYPWPSASEFHEWNPAKKGWAAVQVVLAAVKYHRFPLWVQGQQVRDRKTDILGTDVIVVARRKIQVKSDGSAYSKAEGGTGNLFIQTHERNPLGLGDCQAVGTQ